jgi:hypothetical protein
LKRTRAAGQLAGKIRYSCNAAAVGLAAAEMTSGASAISSTASRRAPRIFRMSIRLKISFHYVKAMPSAKAYVVSSYEDRTCSGGSVMGRECLRVLDQARERSFDVVIVENARSPLSRHDLSKERISPSASARMECLNYQWQPSEGSRHFAVYVGRLVWNKVRLTKRPIQTRVKGVWGNMVAEEAIINFHWCI